MNDIELKSSSDDQSSKDVTDEFLQKYIPISEFCALKNIAEDNVIVMIRDGVVAGYTRKNQWFVDRHELVKQFGEKNVGKINKKLDNALKIVVSIFAFAFFIPILLICTLFSYMFSAPGFYSDGSLNGHAYAVIFIFIAMGTVILIAYFFSKSDSKKSTQNNAGASTNNDLAVKNKSAVNIQLAIFTIVSIGLGLMGFVGIIWLILTSIFDGWCNPRC